MFFYHEPISSLGIAATYPIPTYFIWVASEGRCKRSQICATTLQIGAANFGALVQKLDECAQLVALMLSDKNHFRLKIIRLLTAYGAKLIGQLQLLFNVFWTDAVVESPIDTFW